MQAPPLREIPNVVEMDYSDVSMGEVCRRLDRLESVMQASLKAIDDRMAGQLVNRDYYETRHTALSQRVSDLESVNQVQASRAWTIVTALAVTFLSSVAAVIIAVTAHH